MARLGRVYLDASDIYAILAIILVLFAYYARIPIPFIGAQNLLVLTIFLLIAKAFLPTRLIGYLLFFILLYFILRTLLPFPLSLPYFPLILLIFLLILLFGFLR